MNALERHEQRKAQKRNPENGQETLLGETIAKHIIGITEADRAVRRNGRLKNAFRTGTVGLMGAKVMSEMVARTADALSGNFGLDENITTYELNGGWIAPAAIALYGVSRMFRYVQNTHHKTAMCRRDEFRNHMGVDSNGIADGAINVIGDFFDIRTVVGLTEEDSGDPLTETFLYITQPTIPKPVELSIEVSK